MPTFPTKPSALLAAISSSPGSAAFILAYTSIHLMQSSGIKPTTETYDTLVAFGTTALYNSGTRPLFTAYMELYGVTPIAAYI